MTTLTEAHRKRWPIDYVVKQARDYCTEGAAVHFVFDDASDLILTFWNANSSFLGNRDPYYQYRCQNCPQIDAKNQTITPFMNWEKLSCLSASIVPHSIVKWGQHGLQKMDSRDEFTSMQLLFKYLSAHPDSPGALEILFTNLVNATQFRTLVVISKHGRFTYQWDQIMREGTLRHNCRYTAPSDA
jgi:hypothetical protein